jgi:outer membrane receptor protein involved in Fe transport
MNMTDRARLRSTLLATVAAGLIPAAATAQPVDTSADMPAMTQASDPDDASAQPADEEIVVTGSRIARTDLTSSSPMAVVGSEEFKLSGAVNVEQLLNTLPQVVPGVSAFSNNPGGGVATVNLRGLGAARTLVLVNGRRYIFFDFTQTVDLNNIPQFLVDGVDVVTGGASAVYGSDAIAGVVNFRMRKIEGLELGGQYSITGKGDGQRWNVNAAFGSKFADGAGHVVAYADYFKRKAVFADARSFSDTIYNENATDDGLVPSGSATVPGGRFTVGPTISVPGGNGLGGVTMKRGVGNWGTTNGSLYTGPNTSRPYVDPSDAYNFAPDNLLQVPQERWLIGAYGSYDVNDAIKPYMELTFANNIVAGELAPTPVTGTFSIATNNPFLSAADRASLAQIDANEAAIDAARVARGLAPQFNDPGFVGVSVARRVNDAGSRMQTFERNAWRVVAGSTGSITDDLTYDAYYLFSRSRNSNVQYGNISRSAFGAGLRNNTLNIFGPGSLSEADVKSISITTQNTLISQLQVGTASVSGKVANLGWGADDIGFAAGAEWRAVSSEVIPDQALSSGDVIGFNGAQPTKGGYSVKEAFGELLIPIVGDQPFAKDLTIRGAARYSDYELDKVGGVLSWAAGIEWAPIQDIRFRAQFQRASRAPNVSELFGGQFQNFPSAIDPCGSRSAPATRTAEVRALCIASGVPAGAVFTNSIQPNSQIESLGGGNPDLREETSDTFTVGMVFQPRAIPGLNITLDYYKISIEDYITAMAGGTSGILNYCYYKIQDLSSEICGAIKRDPTSGVIGGDFVVRALSANIATLKTAGLDLQVDYGRRLDFGLLGDSSRLKLFFLGSWTKKADFTPVADLPAEVQKCAGTFGAQCNTVFGDPVPKFRFSSRLSWIDGPLTTSLRLRHIGKTTNENIVNDISDPDSITIDRLKPKAYIDASFSWDLNKNITLGAGMNNVFNVMPQIIDDVNDEQSNTYPSTYNPLGREFFITASARF